MGAGNWDAGAGRLRGSQQSELRRKPEASHCSSCYRLASMAGRHISDDNDVPTRVAVVNAHHRHRPMI